MRLLKLRRTQTGQPLARYHVHFVDHGDEAIKHAHRLDSRASAPDSTSETRVGSFTGTVDNLVRQAAVLVADLVIHVLQALTDSIVIFG
jgi:hypothetical protein